MQEVRTHDFCGLVWGEAPGLWSMSWSRVGPGPGEMKEGNAHSPITPPEAATALMTPLDNTCELAVGLAGPRRAMPLQSWPRRQWPWWADGGLASFPIC
jgi:hypothetical protein